MAYDNMVGFEDSTHPTKPIPPIRVHPRQSAAKNSYA